MTDPDRETVPDLTGRLADLAGLAGAPGRLATADRVRARGAQRSSRQRTGALLACAALTCGAGVGAWQLRPEGPSQPAVAVPSERPGTPSPWPSATADGSTAGPSPRPRSSKPPKAAPTRTSSGGYWTPPLCTAEQIAVADLGDEGVSGSRYRSYRLLNQGTHCRLTGAPARVYLVGEHGEQIGRDADREGDFVEVTLARDDRVVLDVQTKPCFSDGPCWRNARQIVIVLPGGQGEKRLSYPDEPGTGAGGAVMFSVSGFHGGG